MASLRAYINGPESLPKLPADWIGYSPFQKMVKKGVKSEKSETKAPEAVNGLPGVAEDHSDEDEVEVVQKKVK